MKRTCLLGACLAIITAGCELDESEHDSPLRAQVVVSPDASVTGIVRNIAGLHGDVPFTAVIAISEFVGEGGAVYGIGQLSQIGGASPAASQSLAAQPLKLPVSLVPLPGDGGAASLPRDGGACPVLALMIKPVTVDLLGVRVALGEIDLGAKAVSGSGNLLGNVLCGVFEQLDPSGLLTGLDPNLSQRIVGFLNGLTGGIIEGIVDAINGEGQDIPGRPTQRLSGLDAGVIAP